MTNWIKAIGTLIRQDRPATGTLTTERLAAYDAEAAYYHNTAYEALANGGMREQIAVELGNATVADLAGLYNPVAAVVDLYQHVLGGSLGDTLRFAADLVATEEALTQLWTWSNLDVRKQLLCEYAANHGTCGLRIVAQDDPDPARRRVWIKPEHPRIVRDVEQDQRGNLTAVLLEYELEAGIGDDRTVYAIRELQTKEAFQTWRIDRGAAIPFDTATLQPHGPGAVLPNRLGIVPYVLLTHRPTGGAFGLNAWYRARVGIDRLNALIVHINTQIHRHVKAKWFIAAAGEAPETVELSDMTVAYVNTTGSTNTPIMAPLVANLSLADAIAEARFLIEQIEDMLPELKALAGRFLAGQSGETVAQLRRPAEDRLGLARASYEDALVRAQQIALSWGIVLGLWDLGTGMGTPEAADAAYRSGAEDHGFAPREVLPLTPQERNLIAQGVGDDVSRAERLRLRGYDDAQIAAIMAERTAEQEQAVEMQRRQFAVQQPAAGETQQAPAEDEEADEEEEA